MNIMAVRSVRGKWVNVMPVRIMRGTWINYSLMCLPFEAVLS